MCKESLKISKQKMSCQGRHFRCELGDENLSQKMQSTLFTILTFLTFDISPNL